MSAPTRVRLPMVCVCGVDNVREDAADLRRAALFERMGRGDGKSFLSTCVYQLQHGCRASIEAIYCDQWSVVCVEAGYGADKILVSVECDRVEDGLVAIIEYLSDLMVLAGEDPFSW